METSFKVEDISGIGEYSKREIVNVRGQKEPGDVYVAGDSDKAFLVLRPNTIEVRTDANLAKLLREKYETVMQSRYFGRGGIEVVMAGQISLEELYDLARLSYNLTIDKK